MKSMTCCLTIGQKLISNDGWTYPEVKAVKRKETTDKKTKQTKVKETVCMYDEIVCDLLPVSVVLAEYFSVETAEIVKLSELIDRKQADMDDLVEQNTEVFAIGDDDEQEENKEVSVKAADVKAAIKNAKKDGTSEENVKLLQQWIALSNEKDALNKSLKEKRSQLTDAVVAKYSVLTEDEIKMLVVERKWLASVISGCKALMQNVTHRISNDITALVERYETTLSETTNAINDLEKEVLASLQEMGFTV